MAKLKAPVMLTILDGFGIGDVNDPTNAVVQAKPENFFKIMGNLSAYTITGIGSRCRLTGRPNG